MFRVLARILGLAFLAGIVIPPLAALVTKRQLEEAGRGVFDPTADELDTALIFEGGEFASTAPSFTGGELLTWYGGGRLDLRGATIAPEGADLRIRAIFGGVQLVVPTTWRVEAVTTTPIMGGIANMAATPEDPNAPVLRVSTMAIFGGVAIANEATSPLAEGGIGDIIRSATDQARDAVDEATAEAERVLAEARERASDAGENVDDATSKAADAMSDAKSKAADAMDDAAAKATEAAG